MYLRDFVADHVDCLDVATVDELQDGDRRCHQIDDPMRPHSDLFIQL